MKKKETKKLDLLYTLSRDKEKVYTMCVENMCRILEDHPSFSDRLKYDEFKNIIEIRFGKKWSQLADHHAIAITNEIATEFSFFQRVTTRMVHEAILTTAKKHSYDSAHDFLASLKWDGEARLDSWLSHTYGVDGDEYHKAVGSNWLKGLVKRIIQPGCKFDYIMVIEGPQGSRKSSSLSIIGGEWYVETFMNTESKDFFMQFAGKALIEFSEGETLSRTDVKRMKAVITTQTDRYRAPYAKNAEDYPRRCVFAMTTNETEYLKDETGNRRWLPVTMVKDEADTDWLEANRNQLLAEAYHRVVVLKETVHEFPKQETMAHQERRVESNPNRELIEDWYWNTLKPGERAAGITINWIYSEVLHRGFPSKPIAKYDEMIIGGVLKTIGLEKRRVMHNNIRVNRWFNTTEVESIYQPEPLKNTQQQFDDF